MRPLRLFADGIPATAEYINSILDDHDIDGFTCNPTLIKQYAPITYRGYCDRIIELSRGRSVSIQVLSSRLDQMYEQAKVIHGWSSNIHVKIPTLDGEGNSTSDLVVRLLDEGIKINVTTVFHADHVRSLVRAGMTNRHNCILSIFSGRIADTGVHPNSIISDIADIVSGADGNRGSVSLLWAGVRSPLDIHLAAIHCDIITLPTAIVDKLRLRGKNLDEYTFETVKMFAKDSQAFTLE